MDRTEPDRLRALVDLVVESLDEAVDAPTLARRAFVSRSHFDHLLAAALGEAPGRFRRRLLLERAAWQLTRRDTAVTDAAIEAGYGSLEAFTRAFRRAFGAAPTRFLTDRPGDFRLTAPNGVHFHPPAGLLLQAPADRERRPAMDLTDRLLEHDLWITRRLVERAAALPDAQLDEPVEAGEPRMAFDAAAPTVRSMLDRMVFTKEMWTAAIAGRPFEPATDTTMDGLRRRLDDAGTAFVDVVREIRDGDQWDATFVDATCEPPESFTFGGMVAHVVTFSAARRQTLIRALRALGADDVGIGDPIEWERTLA